MNSRTTYKLLQGDSHYPDYPNRANNENSSHKLLPSTGPSITLQQIDTRRQFAALASEWDNFLAQTETPSPFLTWDYLDVWWDVFGDKGYDIKLYIARDTDGYFVGAVPLMISQRGAFEGARGRFRHLAFMGGVGEVCGESLEIPALPGFKRSVGEAAADMIVSDLHGQWDVIFLHLVPEASRSTNAMLAKLEKYGIPSKVTHKLSSPVLPINSSWDEYLMTRSKNTRGKIRRMISKAENEYGMRHLQVGKDVAMGDAYEELIRLSRIRWGTSQAQAFHSPEFIDFHWKLAPRFQRIGRLHFGLIELNNKIAAASYDFIYDNKMWGYQLPWDPKFANASVGNVLDVLTNKSAFDLGLREIDYLPGESGSKNKWATDFRVLNIVEAACPRSMGGTLFNVARGVDRLLKKKQVPSQ